MKLCADVPLYSTCIAPFRHVYVVQWFDIQSKNAHILSKQEMHSNYIKLKNPHLLTLFVKPIILVAKFLCRCLRNGHLSQSLMHTVTIMVHNIYGIRVTEYERRWLLELSLLIVNLPSELHFWFIRISIHFRQHHFLVAPVTTSSLLSAWNAWSHRWG